MKANVARVQRFDDGRLGQLEAGLAEALRRIDALESRRRRTPDPESDAQLLGVLARIFGESCWSSRDVRRVARADKELRQVLSGISGRQLGAWLGRLRRAPGPYVLDCIGRDGSGCLWTLRVSADSHTHQRPRANADGYY